MDLENIMKCLIRIQKQKNKFRKHLGYYNKVNQLKIVIPAKEFHKKNVEI